MPPLVDAVPALALLVLLATAYRHPSGRVEALIGVIAAAATLATGILDREQARSAVAHLAPVVAFLATILVVSHVCGWRTPRPCCCPSPTSPTCSRCATSTSPSAASSLLAAVSVLALVT